MPQVDQLVKLLTFVTDDETGYQFPPGTIGTVEMQLNEQWCMVTVENRIADVHDTGTSDVMVKCEDLLVV